MARTDESGDALHTGRGGSDATLEDLVADYLGRLTDGERLDRARILAEHPELGEEILSELEVFVELRADGDDNTPLGTLGDYTLHRQIGRGGMGVVYEAWQGSLDRQVALKVLPAGIAADNRAFIRFMREAKTAAQLNHQNVVSVYGMGVEQDTPYYSMEYVEGETLAQLLARIKDADDETETPFGPKNHGDYFVKLARAFADVADGLQHAHSKGVTHRDIKPSNLILDGEGRLRILDFGLARLEGQDSLTISGDVVGTPLYMSPEQARRKKISVDHRTDVYSLGATMYEAICGRPPFRGKDHADTLSQIIERDPVEPRKLSPRVAKDLETIVLKCLRKDSDDRYGTAEALGQDLRRFVRGDAVEARPQTSLERWTRRARVHRRSLLVAVVVALLSGFLLHLGIREWRESPLKVPGLSQEADALYHQGKHEEALTLIHRVLDIAPENGYARLVRGNIEEHVFRDLDAALESYVSILETSDPAGMNWRQASHGLRSVLHRHAVMGGDPRLDGFVVAFRPSASSNPEEFLKSDPMMLATWAMVLLRAREERDVEQARKVAERVLKMRERSYSFATLASIEHDRGEVARAVRLIERAVAVDEKCSSYLVELLERRRQAIPTEHISYATVDARGVDPEATAVAETEAKPTLTATSSEEARAEYYYRARLLEEQARADEAEEMFRQLTSVNPESTAPRLGVFRCRLAGEDAEGAAKYLGDWLLEARVEEPRPWESWLALCFSRLLLSPAEILDRLGASSAASKPSRYLDDLRWLLERLDSGRRFGILAGSEVDRAVASRDWSRDRFFHFGGYVADGPTRSHMESTAAEIIYGEVRRFGGLRAHRNCRIPLPPGRYRVTVWLAGSRCGVNEEARRIRVESQAPTRCSEVDLGPTGTSRRSADVSVGDGLLDIEFDPVQTGHLDVAALEIEYLE